jgi:hypothetical protein
VLYTVDYRDLSAHNPGWEGTCIWSWRVSAHCRYWYVLDPLTCEPMMVAQQHICCDMSPYADMDDFTPGVVYREIWGRSCLEDCNGPSHPLGVVDYREYDSQYDDWEGTCIWSVPDGDDCENWFALSPDCEVIFVCSQRLCDSSSSSSSSVVSSG